MHFVIQKQNHTNDINIVGKGTSPWMVGDGMVCYERNVALIVYGADCAILSFSNHQRIGACHAGWKGYSNGIIKKMNNLFVGGDVFVGPFLHRFEVQKDDCYRQIENYCGDRYFSKEDGKIIFDFKSAVLAELKETNLILDPRSTFEDPKLGSFRRDGKRGDGTQNRVVVWRNEVGEVFSKVFLPSQDIRSSFLEVGY